MIIPVCCIHNFMLQNYIASCVLLVYKLQRCVPKLRILLLMIVFQKVCKSQIFYFCNGTIKNEYLWNLHMNKSRK